MDFQSRRELRRRLEEMLDELPPAPWVVDMIDHYQRNGWYRPADLRQLLGDPTDSVEVPMEGQEMEALKAVMARHRASR